MRDFQLPGRSAVQAIVEPQSTGIGGDCFVLYTKAGSDRVFALDGSGRAPLAASIEAFRALGLTAVPSHGPHSVTIPGAIDAWDRLSRDHGRKPLADCLAEAIRYAEAGYVVHDRVAFDWAETADLLAADPHSAAIFLPEGIPLRAGDLHRQPALAGTLRRVAAQGRDGFYKGPAARAMVARLRELGGCTVWRTLRPRAATGSSRCRSTIAATASTRCRKTTRALPPC